MGKSIEVPFLTHSVYWLMTGWFVKASQSAVDDYNRARAYLADIANRDGVPVLSDITEALDCVLKQLLD